MAAGFVDVFRRVWGWWSPGPTTLGPYRVAAGEVFHTGQTAGEVFVTGQVAGEVDGRSG